MHADDLAFIGTTVCAFLRCAHTRQDVPQVRTQWATFLHTADDILEENLPVHKGCTLFELCVHYKCPELASMVIDAGASLELHMHRNLKQCLLEKNEEAIQFWRSVLARWNHPSAPLEAQHLARKLCSKHQIDRVTV